MIRITGHIKRIKYAQNNFLIAILTDDKGRDISIKGNMPGEPQYSLEYTFDGEWQDDPKWGKQFSFKEYKVSYPTDLTAIASYLDDNAKWVGPEIARRIVDLYGSDTLVVCKDDPERVARDIKGVTIKRATEIAAMLRMNESNENLQIALKNIFDGIRISKRVVNQIIANWGQAAPAKIAANPYAMIEAFDGVGFITADQIARRVGFDLAGSPRVRAGILYTLKDMAFSGGHTCLPNIVLLEATEKILTLPGSRIFEELTGMIADNLIIMIDKYIYLPAFYEDEKLIAEKIKVLAAWKFEAGPDTPDLDGLAADQVDAMTKALASGVFILTGAPGTGKTYTISHIINSFPRARIELAAPTGKAAKRIIEQAGRNAQTIHRLLEPQKIKDKFVFARDADNPIEADLIVLDEMSMVDVPLFARFLDAVKPGTRLVLVGDTYQLPSVGPGNVLKDLITSGVVPYTELTIIKRQDAGLIINNCHKIKAGHDIEINNVHPAQDFFFIRMNDETTILKTIFDLVDKRLPEKYKVDKLRDIQVISPLREKTGLSCLAINSEFQRNMNPAPALDKIRFKEGDKVIQTKNDYDLNIINGDIGYVSSIRLDSKEIVVQFENPERVVEIPLYSNELELAYAVTCHKFQGSEAPIVVIPIHKSFGGLIMQRNWLYTAISRAKDVCVLVGQTDETAKIIGRNKQQKRYTMLNEKLKG